MPSASANISTATGKQLYRSRWVRSEDVIAAARSAASTVTPTASVRPRSRRLQTLTMWFVSALASGNTHRSSGTPSRRASAAEQKSSAPA